MWRQALLHGAMGALILGMVACATASDRHDVARNLVRQAGWRWGVLTAGIFDVAVALPPLDTVGEMGGQVLTVYLEGDGFAFVHPNQPSADPTPTDPIALRLALAQPGSGPVAWLARPCQYAQPDHGRSCQSWYWTNGRYAEEILSSLGEALDQVKRRTNTTHLILVGYSGGGALAAVLAARRGDVDGLITVAADLDLAYWTGRDHLTPLTGSLDPALAAPQLGHVPQVHFTGGRDQVVGSDVVVSFRRHLPVGTPVTQLDVPDFDHKCCWVRAWPQYWGRALLAITSLTERR